MGRSRRKSRNRSINPVFYVFCEGKTEQEYINVLRQIYRLPIVIKPKVLGQNISSKHIVKCLKNELKTDKDRIYLMYDLDVEEMLERLQKIKRELENVTLLLSNPCVELWFLFHKQTQNSSISSKECLKALKKQYKNYKKGVFSMEMKNDFNLLKLEAVTNATQNIDYKNPSSTIYNLIEDLEEIAESKK